MCGASVIARQQVLKLLINYTHRWFARFFLGVMDTTGRNTRTGNKYVAMYVHSESVEFTHECLAECEGKLNDRLQLHDVVLVCGWLFFIIRACVAALYWSWRGWHRGASRVCRCYFSRAPLACTVSFLRFLCFIVFLCDYKNERCRRYCSLTRLLSCTAVPNDFLKPVRLHYNGIIKRCNRLQFLPC